MHLRSLPLLTTICVLSISVSPARAANKSEALSVEDQRALAVGRAILKLDEIAKAGAPLMTAEQTAELEKNVKFLTEIPATQRFTWAWLEFRLRSDRSLALKNNPHADAINQRLRVLAKLLRKYCILE